MKHIGRRAFIGGVLGLIATPAIVKFDALMPVRGIVMPIRGGNALLTIDMITREAIALFVNSNEFLRNIDDQWDNEFSKPHAKIGTTLRIRLPTDFSVRQTADLVGQLPEIPTPAAIALGAAAVIASNPPLNRRRIFGLS